MKGLIYKGVPNSRFAPEMKSPEDCLFTGGPEGPESPEQKREKGYVCRRRVEGAEDDREAFEERAAILEFDAGLPREEAEHRARELTHYLGW